MREDFASRLEDLVDQAVTLQRGKRQDFRGQEKDQANQGSGFDGTSRQLVGRTFGVGCQSAISGCYGLVKCCEHPDTYIGFAKVQADPILALVTIHAWGQISFCLSIPTVLPVGRFSKVFDPVIQAVAVDVINQRGLRPVVPLPDQAVDLALNPVHYCLPVATSLAATY